MRLWLVRHIGETEGQCRRVGSHSGHAPTPLTEELAGAENAHSSHAPFDQVLCSELERARHTAPARTLERARILPQHILPELNAGMYFWRLGNAPSPRPHP